MASRFVYPLAGVGSGIVPADGAKLFFFASGTSTAKATFTDEGLTIPNANPVIADASGVFGDIWMQDGDRYKMILEDRNGVQQPEVDPVIGGLLNGASGVIYDTVAAMKLSSPVAGTRLITLGYYAAGDGGGAEYLSAASASVDGFGDHTLANGVIALIQTTGAVFVIQYGAKGDGSTDDTASIQAACDSGTTNVIFSAGRVYLAGNITSNGQKLTGSGAVFIKDSTKDHGLIIGGAGPQVSGFTFNPQPVASQPHSDIKIADGSSDVNIYANTFSCISGAIYSAIAASDDSSHSGGDFPYTTNVVNLSVNSNTFRGYTRPVFWSCIDGYRISNNYFTGSDFDAIRIREVIGDGMIVDNTFIDIGDPTSTDEQTRDAIDTAWSGKNLLISGNFIKGVRYVGIDVKGNVASSANGYGSNFVTITNNHIEDTHMDGIAIGTADNVDYIISNNRITLCNNANISGGGGVGNSGITLKGGIKRVSITGNHLSYCYGRGIYLNSGDGVNEFVQVKDNIVVNCTDRGMQLAESSYIQCIGNTVINVAAETNGDAMLFGIGLTGTAASSQSTFVSDNIIKDCVTGQVTFSGSGFLQDSIFSWRNNYEEGPLAYNTGSGTGRFAGKEPRVRWSNGTLPSSSAGTFNVGDILYYDTPVAAGNIGRVCVTAGTPGTWKDFGVIGA